MELTSLDALTALYAAPVERVVRKEIAFVDPHIRRFIGLSPFVVVASGDAAMNFDASPRGGAPGFVKVLDEHRLLIPDAQGNNRLDTLRNIIATKSVGLLFMIPGIDETVRVNGSATLRTDADLLAHFSGHARPPKVVIDVQVRAAYLHCAKSIMRSKLWDVASQVDRDVFPTMAQIFRDQTRLDIPDESREAMRKRFEDHL